jgi:hypothetical protein
MVCEKETSQYDRALNDLYKLLMKHLSDEKKAELKTDQKKWLKKDRNVAFKAEADIRKNKTFADSERGYADRLLSAYGIRLRALCIRYTAELKKILFYKLSKIKSQEKLSPSLEVIFCIWYHAQTDHQIETPRSTNVYSLETIQEDRLLRQTDGAWLLLWRGNSYFDLTNNDGGCYSFKLISPTAQTIVDIQAEDHWAEKNQRIQSKDIYLKFQATKLLLLPVVG